MYGIPLFDLACFWFPREEGHCHLQVAPLTARGQALYKKKKNSENININQILYKNTRFLCLVQG